jgi:hypothetical protein
MLAPWTPLGVSSVSALVSRAITRAGVESPHRGGPTCFVTRPPRRCSVMG